MAPSRGPQRDEDFWRHNDLRRVVLGSSGGNRSARPSAFGGIPDANSAYLLRSLKTRRCA
jgi:hypothetical protein